jgi:hypothetical protein
MPVIVARKSWAKILATSARSISALQTIRVNIDDLLSVFETAVGRVKTGAVLSPS